VGDDYPIWAIGVIDVRAAGQVADLFDAVMIEGGTVVVNPEPAPVAIPKLGYVSGKDAVFVER